MAPDRIIVLVSGANNGIGYEIVKKLALEHSTTHHLLLGCRDTHEGETAVASMGAPTNVNPIQLDVTSDESVQHCYKTIEQMFGHLDILINNASEDGVKMTTKVDSGKGGSYREVYKHVFDVNVIGVEILTDTMLPLLEKSTLPKIIFISSILGSITGLLNKGLGRFGLPWYRASKAALNMLCAHYAINHPNWKINASAPTRKVTNVTGLEMVDGFQHAKGAENAVRLALEGPDGATGTFSDVNGEVPW